MIRGRKVNLVAVSTSYLPYYVRWINDPEVTDMLGDFRFPISKGKELDWLEGHMSNSDSTHVFTVLTKNGEPIGNIGFNRMDYQNSYAVLGIMIGEKGFWGKGYGTDAIKTLLRFGFQELGLNKIELAVDVLNERAISCYKKCGFVVEGRLRKNRFYKGKYCDEFCMGLLRDEWETIYRKEERARARK